MFLRFLVVLAAVLPAIANEGARKDPEALANEARKAAADLRKEAEHFKIRAEKDGRTLTSDEEKYLSYTLEEADLLGRSGEAWEKNQMRMAEKFREKAAEFCRKRGEMAAKLKLWDDACAPASDEKAKPSTTADKVAEIEKQQAELEAQKKALLETEAGGR